MYSEKEIEERLSERNIRPTAIRILVLRKMLEMNQDEAFSLLDLENRLDTVDKSTLFRTLTLFHDNLLVHSIDDGSGSIKYSLCKRGCECFGEASHVHFSCTLCHRTFCFEKIAIPRIDLPVGFSYESANFVFKGVCSVCSRSQK